MDNSTLPLSDVFVASAYIIVPLLILPIYVIILYLFLTDVELKRIQAYTLMVHLGFFDCLQLISHSSGGILTLFKSICTDHTYLCKFLGATLNTAWTGLFPMTFLVALNRILVVTRKLPSEQGMPLYFKVLLCFGWAYFLGFYACCLSFATVTYFPDDWTWSYASDNYSQFMEKIEYFVSMTTIISVFFIYLAVIVVLICMKGTLSQGSSRIRTQERNILIQAVVVFVNVVLLINAWHNYEILFEGTKETFFFINMYWILFLGLNPLLYLTMNRTIRRKVFLFISGKRTTSLPTISVSRADRVTITITRN